MEEECTTDISNHTLHAGTCTGNRVIIYVITNWIRMHGEMYVEERVECHGPQ